MRIILYKNDKGIALDRYIGFEKYREQNNDYGWFGKDRPIPPNRKLLATEEVMDTWLAGHWGFEIEDVPGHKPNNMPRFIHKYLRDQYVK